MNSKFEKIVIEEPCRTYGDLEDIIYSDEFHERLGIDNGSIYAVALFYDKDRKHPVQDMSLEINRISVIAHINYGDEDDDDGLMYWGNDGSTYFVIKKDNDPIVKELIIYSSLKKLYKIAANRNLQRFTAGKDRIVLK